MPGDEFIMRHVDEADPILLRLYIHSNFIDTVLLYRKVRSLLMQSRNTREVLQKSYWQLMIVLKKQFQIL